MSAHGPRARLRRRLLAFCLVLWLVPILAPRPAESTVLFGVLGPLGALGLAFHCAAIALAPRARPGFALIALVCGCAGAALCSEAVLRWREERLPRGVLRLLGAAPFRLSDPRVSAFDGPWIFRGVPNLDLPESLAEPELVRQASHRAHPLAEANLRVALRLDGEGMRNPPGRERAEVVCVGDSFTFGWNLPRSAAWPALLETPTRRAYSVAYNAWGPSQELAALKGFGLARQPKWVVWTLFLGNDLSDEIRYQKALRAGPRPQRPAPPARTGSRLRALLLWLGDRLPAGLLRHARSPRTPLVVELGGRKQALAFSHTYLLELAKAPVTSEHPGVVGTLEALRAGRAACQEAGARLLVVLIPSKPQVAYPLLAPELRHALLRDTLRAEFARLVALKGAGALPAMEAAIDARLLARQDTLRATLEAALRAEGIATLDLVEPLRASYRAGEPPYFALDSHWNQRGQALCAEAVGAWIEQASR